MPMTKDQKKKAAVAGGAAAGAAGLTAAALALKGKKPEEVKATGLTKAGEAIAAGAKKVQKAIGLDAANERQSAITKAAAKVHKAAGGTAMQQKAAEESPIGALISKGKKAFKGLDWNWQTGLRKAQEGVEAEDDGIPMVEVAIATGLYAKRQ